MRRSALRFMMTAMLLIGLLTASSFAAKVPTVAGEPSWDFDSPQWDAAERVTDFKVKVDGGVKDPSEPTRVDLLHHDGWLYIRFTATDSKMDQLRVEPLDEFADRFPHGDHGELYFTGSHWLLAFDASGNRYDARYFDALADSGFRIKSRRTPSSWQVIVAVPLRRVAGGGKPFNLRFTRHLDHGLPSAERSVASYHVELE